MENEGTPVRVRILVFEDLPGIWSARVLEHDVAAEGRTMETAVHAVLRIIRAQVDFDRRHNREPLSSGHAAPQSYWNAFTQATPLEWAARLAGVLPVAAEISAAVALERPRARGTFGGKLPQLHTASRHVYPCRELLSDGRAR